LTEYLVLVRIPIMDSLGIEVGHGFSLSKTFYPDCAAQITSLRHPSPRKRTSSGDCSTTASALTATESEHRKNMIFSGPAISQSQPVAVQLLAKQLVGVLPNYLGRPLPVPDEEAVEIIATAMLGATGLCDDHKAEIDATVEFVGKNLKDHGVTSGPRKNERKN
jgi:hypothetical protein